MSAFFGNMLIALRNGISSTTASAVANGTTSTITASVSGGRGTYTYAWQKSGIACTINSSTSAATTITGSSTIGSTTIYCNITDTITGNMLSTPICTITWTSIPITGMTFSVPASFAYNGTSTGTISVSVVTPGGATYSPSSQTFGPAAGTYSLTSSGTGNYSGSFTSSSFTIYNPLAVVSMSSTAGVLANGGDGTTTGTATGGVPPYSISWTRVSGVACTLRSSSGNPTSTASWFTSATSGTSSLLRMTVTDSLSNTASNTVSMSWAV